MTDDTVPFHTTTEAHEPMSATLTNAPLSTRHARRLLKLADKLDTVQKQEFDMATWCHRRTDNRGSDCGTAACALGWAGTIPAFRKAGLVTKFPRPGETRNGYVEYTPTLPSDIRYSDEVDAAYKAEDRFYEPRAVHDSFDAARRFFGLAGKPEGSSLFVPQVVNERPKAVARRIRKAVKEYRPDVYRAYLDRKRAVAA